MKLTLLSLTTFLLTVSVSAIPTPTVFENRQPHEIHQHHHHHHGASGSPMTLEKMKREATPHEVFEHHHHHHADGTEMTSAEMEDMKGKRGAHEGHLGEGMQEAREDGDIYGTLW